MSGSIVSGLIGAGATLLLAVLGYLVFFGRKFEKIDRIGEDQKDQAEKIKEFDREIATLKEFKTTAQKFIDSTIYQTKSPVSLTDFGMQLIKESGFNDIFEQEKDNLVEMLEKKNPKTQYDVQEMARTLMNELIEYEPFQPIKKYAFEKGKDYSQILRAGAIPLRDYYLEQHKEIVS